MRMLILFFAAIVVFLLLTPGIQAQKPEESKDHVLWVADALKEMQKIRVGMTRKDLLETFTTEGGLSSRLTRRYVYKECPYIKVDVEFLPAQPGSKESPDDKIVHISKPFLEFSILD